MRGGGGGDVDYLRGHPDVMPAMALGSHVQPYFVKPCPVLRSFTFLSFGNEFSLKMTKHALE